MTKVERSAQKYDRGNRSHCGIIAPAPHLLLPDVITQNHAGESITSFRWRAMRRHKTKTGGAVSGMKLRTADAGLHCRDLWCAACEKAT
jgi:hypothetical protein